MLSRTLASRTLASRALRVLVPLAVSLAVILAGCVSAATRATVATDAKACSDAVGTPAVVSAETFACNAMGAAFGSTAGADCALAVAGVGLLCRDAATLTSMTPPATTASVGGHAAPDYKGTALRAIAARGVK